ncbi:MAG TPA: MFS transporter [Candidatus Eisenbacteria bacterium]|jgi:FSR family fosmidomycin resistance protein-like MFS transporter
MRSYFTPRLGLLTVGHLTIDSYSSFFSPLLPLLVQKLHLSLTLVGTLVALASVTSSFSQPVFGLLSDRLRRPWFVAFGPLLAAVFMSGLGLAPSYPALVALLLLAGVGVAAFHPQAAVLASSVSPRRNLAMAFFVTGGTLGFSLGPMFAVGVVEAFGLERTWLAAIPGLLVAGLLLAWFARVTPRPRHEAQRPPLRALRPVLRPLSLLYFATVSRSAVSYGFMTFLPLYLHARGFGLPQTGAMLSLYLLLGALGGFVGGWLSDRVGGHRVIVSSFVGAAPLYLAFLHLPDAVGIPCLILGSFVLQSSLPVNVVLGQELSPQHSSTISSLLMGAAWGVGALIIGPVGALADRSGLHAALTTLAGMLLVGLACAVLLPGVRGHTPAVVEAG